MAISKYNGAAQDGHHLHSDDVTWFAGAWTVELDSRMSAVTTPLGVVVPGIAQGLDVEAIPDAVVVGKGVGYTNTTAETTRVQLDAPVTVPVTPADAGKWLVLRWSYSTKPSEAHTEGHPITGLPQLRRSVIKVNASLVVAVGVADVVLCKITAHTLGSAPTLSTTPPTDRGYLTLGTLNGAIVAVPVVVVANDGSGDFADLQSAVDSLPDSGGKIFVKPGIFNVTQPITIQKDNVVIEGSGPATRLRAVFSEMRFAVSSSVSGQKLKAMIFARDKGDDEATPIKGFVLSDMALGVASDEQDEDGILAALVSLRGASGATLSGLTFRNPPQEMTRVYGVLLYSDTEQSSVQDCYWDSFPRPMATHKLTSGTITNFKNRVRACVVDGGAEYHAFVFEVADDPRLYPGSGTAVTGCIVVGSGGNQFDAIRGLQHDLFQGNVLTKWRTGIAMRDSTPVFKLAVGSIAVGNCCHDNSDYGINMIGGFYQGAVANSLRANGVGTVTAGPNNVVANNAG